MGVNMTAIAKLILISILSVALAAVADEGSVISDIREAKTGNPIIELHPSANPVSYTHLTLPTNSRV